MNFSKVIDNLEEDTLSDDELIVQIKTWKVAELNKRADLVFEDTAIKQVLEESKNIACKLKRNSLIASIKPLFEK